MQETCDNKLPMYFELLSEYFHSILGDIFHGLHNFTAVFRYLMLEPQILEPL